MSSQRGSAALLGLMMMMLLGSMGTVLLLLSKTDLQIASNHRDGSAAQYLAEAGIQYATSKLKTDYEFVLQTENVNGVTTSQSLGTMPTAGSYTVHTGLDPQFKDDTQIRLITATGQVNQAKRQVIAQLTLPLQSNDNNLFTIKWNY